MRGSLRKLTFALANTAAVLAALYVAFARDLERPYWAMFTVFIVANPIVGAVRSKAVYRVFGTLLGASISIFLIPPLVDAPALLCLATSLWVGACVCLSLLDRTPRSYVFLLAGYTATLVGLAVVNQPATVFDTAVSRVEEISLGVICAAIAHSVIFPQSVTAQLSTKIRSTLMIAGTWLSEALMRPERASDMQAQEQLATLVTDLHLLYSHVEFETSNVPRAAGVMRLLRDRLALLLPRVSSVQKAIAALAASGSVSPRLAGVIEVTSHWLRSGVSPEPSAPSILPGGGGGVNLPVVTAQRSSAVVFDWPGLLEQNAITNLRELVTAFADSKMLATALVNEAADLPAHLEHEAAMAGQRPLHRDRGLASLSAFAAAGATLLACALWIEGSWPEGAVAAQFAAIGCSLAATLDDAGKLIRSAILGILFALPFAALYEFAILPRIDGYVALAIVLSPAILLFSLMQASERLGGAGLVLAIAFSGGLALQDTYKADFAAFVNSNAAEIVGLLVAVAMSLVFRTIDPAWNAVRISKAGWREVRRLATDRRVDLPAWTGEMFDRLGLVTSRIRIAGRVARRGDIDGLRDLRVGLNMGTVRGVGGELGSSSRAALERVLTAVSRAYSLRLGNRRDPIDVEETIDQGIASLGAEAPSGASLDGLAALIGLRLDLAPAGSQYAVRRTL
jgi:uncharacterized membrane protein YccC